MFHGLHFISTMQAGTTPIFKVFGMTGPSPNQESKEPRKSEWVFYAVLTAKVIFKAKNKFGRIQS